MNGYNLLVLRRCITIKSTEILNQNGGRLNRELLIAKLNDADAGKKLNNSEILLKYTRVVDILESRILDFAPIYMRLVIEFEVVTYRYYKNGIDYGFLKNIRPGGSGFVCVGPSSIFIHKSRLPGNNFRHNLRLKCWQNLKTKQKILSSKNDVLRLMITDVTAPSHQYAELKIKGSLKIPCGGNPAWY